MDKYRTLAANTALISIGTFASKFLLFFMVRFYTAYLSPSDYGTADLITQTANLLIPVVSFGITDGVFRFAMDSPSLRKNVFSSGILVLFAGGCFFALLSLVLYPMGKLNYEVVLVLVYAICSCIHSLCAQFTRGRGRMQIYAIQGILNTAFVVTLNILFLAGFHMGIIGYVIAISIADLPGIQGTVVGICDLEAGSVHFKKHAEIQYSDDPDNDLLVGNQRFGPVYDPGIY